MRLSLAEQAAEKLFETVILSEAKNLALCIFKKIRRARSFAQFILSGQGEILLPQGEIRMTTVEAFSAASKAPLFLAPVRYSDWQIAVPQVLRRWVCLRGG